MKKWQKRFIAIATALGFVSKVKDGKLSADEQKQIFAEYEKKYKVTFQADKDADEDDNPEVNDYILSSEEQNEIAKLIQDEGDDGDDDDDDDTKEVKGNASQAAPKTGKEAAAAMKETIVKQKKAIKTLSSLPEDDSPTAVIK